MPFLLSLLGLNVENPAVSVTFHKDEAGAVTLTTHPPLNPKSLVPAVEQLTALVLTVPNGTTVEVSRDAADKVEVKLNGEPLAADVGYGTGQVIALLNGLSREVLLLVQNTAERFGDEAHVRAVVVRAFIEELHGTLFDEGDLSERPTTATVVCPTCTMRSALVEGLGQMFGGRVQVMGGDRPEADEEIDDDTLQVVSPIPHEHPLFDAAAQAFGAWINERFGEFETAAALQIRDRQQLVLDRLEAAFPDLPAYVPPPAEEVVAAGDDEGNGLDDDADGADHEGDDGVTSDRPADGAFAT